MILHIDNRQTVKDLQDKFSACFPNLKIEVYKKAHHWKEGSAEKDVVPPKTSLGLLRKKQDSGELDIRSWHTTGSVEQAFEPFGLHVQIFRKSKNGWVQTTLTDNLTLKQQCELARRILVPPSRNETAIFGLL